MRLIPFTNADNLNRRLAKASEAQLPEDERRGAFVPGDDPAELRPVRRLSFSERSHVAIGIRGSDQGRSGAELEEDADAQLLLIGLAGAVLLGIGCAELIAHAADAFGAAYLAN